RHPHAACLQPITESNRSRPLEVMGGLDPAPAQGQEEFVGGGRFAGLLSRRLRAAEEAQGQHGWQPVAAHFCHLLSKGSLEHTKEESVMDWGRGFFGSG